MAMLSVIAQYKAYPQLFDSMQIPEDLDAETLLYNLMMEIGELEVLYSDPVFMASAIYKWSLKQLPIWNHLVETTKYVYNPIWNKDGTITETITGSENLDRNVDNSQNTRSSGESLDSVFGYNSSIAAPESRTDTSGNARSEGNEQTDEKRKHEEVHTRVESGNIGVTSTQSMIREEREIAYFNVYDEIINDFKLRFCLLVY